MIGKLFYLKNFVNKKTILKCIKQNHLINLPPNLQTSLKRSRDKYRKVSTRYIKSINFLLETSKRGKERDVLEDIAEENRGLVKNTGLYLAQKFNITKKTINEQEKACLKQTAEEMLYSNEELPLWAREEDSGLKLILSAAPTKEPTFVTHMSPSGKECKINKEAYLLASYIVPQPSQFSLGDSKVVPALQALYPAEEVVEVLRKAINYCPPTVDRFANR